MENIKSEVYLEHNSPECTRVDIFSHVKKEWVYHSVMHIKEILPLFKDLLIKPEVTIIHICQTHPLFNALKIGKYNTQHFNGMSGRYKVIDGSIYELSYQVPLKPPKSQRELIAKCIESKIKTASPFVVAPENIERNLRHNTWKKI